MNKSGLRMVNAPNLLKINSFFAGTDIIGFQLFIWLFVDDKNKWLRKRPLSCNHEMIHYEQGKELLFVFFWIIYFINWLVNIFVYRNLRDAYRNIVFEKEAYDNQRDLTYIGKRKRYAWLKCF